MAGLKRERCRHPDCRRLQRPDAPTGFCSEQCSAHFSELAKRGELLKAKAEKRAEISKRLRPLIRLGEEPKTNWAKKLYLMSNPAMPGWVKCGETKRDVEKRANDFKTGAHSDFVINGWVIIDDDYKDSDFHDCLKQVAGASNREWFFMPAETAAAVINLAIDGRFDEIWDMPKCEPPSVLATVRTSFGDFVKFRGGRRERPQDEAIPFS